MSERDLRGSGFSEIVTEESRHGIGGNFPPSLLTGDDLKRDLQETHEDLLKRAQDLLAAEARMPKGRDGQIDCADDTTELKLTETVRQIQEVHKSLNVAREAAVAPYDRGRSVAHGFFREVMDKFVDPASRGTNGLKHRCEAALTRYKARKEEEARRVREEEARRRREIEERDRAERETRERAEREAAEEARRREREAERARLAAEEAERAASRKRSEQARSEAEETARAARAKADADARAAEEARQRAAQETQKAQKARDDENKAGQARAEAETRAAVPAAALSRTRSDTAVSSLQEFINKRDVSRRDLDLERLRDFIPDAALDTALTGYMRANSDMIRAEIKNNRQPLRGVTFFIDKRTRVA